MFWLFLGILLWSGVHFLPSIGRPYRVRLIERFGENAYKALFAVAIAVSIILMVIGWRGAEPVVIYAPPLWLQAVTTLLMLIAVILFGAGRGPTRIKQYVRHPQLIGIKTWAVAHLLSNGDSASVLLFGGMLAWAVMEVIFCNRRDGVWNKPEVPSMSVEVIGLVVSLAVFAGLMYLHPYFAGVPLMPH